MPSPSRTRRRVALWVSLTLLAGVASTTAAAGAAPVPRDPAAERLLGCLDLTRILIRTPNGVLRTNYSPSTEDDTTFLARGTTWRPNLRTYPIGIDSGASRTCWMGGEVLGSIPPKMTWEDAHAYNQPCARIVATGWMVVDGLRCDNTDDGFRPRESSVGAQNVTMTVHDTYFTRMHDDCMENDGIIGGVLRDNLWQGCNTGISEQPGSGPFSQPDGEQLVLDHMLMGLRLSPHESGLGENALFKWSSSANDLVIKCSIFKVDRRSLNGPSAMAVPGIVDDRSCPRDPTRLVWLGRGEYPGDLPHGIRVTTRIQVWKHAVTAWKCHHGYQVHGC